MRARDGRRSSSPWEGGASSSLGSLSSCGGMDTRAILSRSTSIRSAKSNPRLRCWPSGHWSTSIGPDARAFLVPGFLCFSPNVVISCELVGGGWAIGPAPVEKTLRRRAGIVQAVESFGIRPVNLRCEGMSNPLGIDVVNPRLSWSLESSERAQKQAAYQIQVASRPELLERDEADLWDSGRVESDESLHIVYQGRPLTSRLVCYWRVKVWPEKGSGPPTSDVATRELWLLEKDDWSAQWIGVRTGETEP